MTTAGTFKDQPQRFVAVSQRTCSPNCVGGHVCTVGTFQSALLPGAARINVYLKDAGLQRAYNRVDILLEEDGRVISPIRVITVKITFS